MLREFLNDETGDMAQTAVIMAAIIIVGYGAFRILGVNIAALVNRVSSAIR